MKQHITDDKKRIRFTHSLTAKVIAFILTAVMLPTALLSIIGAVIMFAENMYNTSKDDYLQSVYSDIEEDLTCYYDGIAESDCHTIVSYIHMDDEESAIKHCIYQNIISVKITDRMTNKIFWEWKDDANNANIVLYNWSDQSIQHYDENDEYGEENYYSAQMTIAIDPTANETYIYTYSSVNEKKAVAESVVNFVYSMLYWILAIGAISIIFAVAGFVFLMCASGHKKGNDEVQAGWGTKIPFDLLSAAAVALITILFMFCLACEQFTEFAIIIAVFIFAGIGIASAILAWCMSFAVRIKLGRWWQNTIIYHLLKLLLKGVKAVFALIKIIPLVWKTALIIVCVSFAELLLLVISWDYFSSFIFIRFVSTVILGGAVLYCAVVIKQLQKGSEALAEGDLSYQIDTSKLFGDFKKHGESLNSIAQGMTLAVEQRMKSERMKTELITNVSHDIKTPLTSIINYTDLISKEPCNNEKINEYSEVLLRQSERLKRLIEDLVEASKASTGNLEVILEPCEANILLTQTMGEYEEKLQNKNLELITTQPQFPILIMADGRRLWRVIDNLMNNICKYAQSSTRVYVSLEKKGNEAVITFKNTSHSPLNISADELMERFVRGDASRNTEGNGLGLSIAKSLTELQQGTLELTVDGDLFKVILRFPIIK